ncbi:diacylglycerol kinase family protein [Chelativorans sp. Marseille-P2723]|uniref:diacylglycerol/lipid kinase family protein n=1 Tax=Chelativorans sp. Marseille-P2723 TaxID=2709133 RepID=UPI00156F7E98|nr:diacylglycerol kinase family protein [Chelativorans sp. Marseille-P2723]
MRIIAVLNRDSGTLSTMNLEELGDRISETFYRAGHIIELRTVTGTEVAASLREATQSEAADAVLVAGGDGTASLAAGLMADSPKALAILPTGTMNLFSRSLRIPLDIDAAITALADGRIRMVDIARANGRPFVHQFSIGIHPQLIRLREQIPFEGRPGKLLASARAAVTTIMRPHNLKVALSIEGKELITNTSAISVTNNLYGEGHLPYADRLDGGILGIYATRARRRWELIAFLANMALGRWRNNEQVDIYEAREVRLRILSPARRFQCALDGELSVLEEEVHIHLCPRSLAVLVPNEG